MTYISGLHVSGNKCEANEASERKPENTMVVLKTAAQVGERWKEWKVGSIPNDKANTNKPAIATKVVMGWARNTEFDSFWNFKLMRLVSKGSMKLRRARIALWGVAIRLRCCRRLKVVLMAKFPCCNSNPQQQNLDQRVVVIPPSFYKKKMSGWVVRTHPPMIKLVFWKLSENRVFLWECCSMSFVKDPYLPESLLRVYIWVKEYGLAMLAGPIVMITAHRVAKQSWRVWCEVTAVRRVFRRRMSPHFMILSTGDASGNMRRFGNVLSSVSCIKDEWQFRRLGH